LSPNKSEILKVDYAEYDITLLTLLLKVSIPLDITPFNFKEKLPLLLTFA
jgi:hypothetical protein